LALGVRACTNLQGRQWTLCGESYHWDITPRDNQLAAACALAQGHAVELDTGEGKTLAAALAATLWALQGRVHVVTANDYLAQRDFDWMNPLLRELGLTVGVVHHDTPMGDRHEQYHRDITYVSVKEIGSDYLRDSLSSEPADLVLPGLEAAILDEVDFILVDEARIPLILAEPHRPPQDSAQQLNEVIASFVARQQALQARLHGELEEIAKQAWPERKKRFEVTFRLAQLFLADPLAPELERALAARVDSGDQSVLRRTKQMIARYRQAKRHDELLEDLLYQVDHKDRTIALTEGGLDLLHQTCGDIFAPPPAEDSTEDVDEVEALRERLAAVHNLLAAHVLYRPDRDYIVHQGQVVLIDQPTGRPSFDRQLQQGLHRALEAKEGLYPALDHQAAAEITFPGLFQLYGRFSGLSGTCLELAGELKEVYKKTVVRIPPHRKVIRTDFQDALFLSERDKERALVGEVRLAQRLEQPLLIGAASVEQSEQLSRLLSNEDISHQVLNARHHEAEARIIARAGRPGAITVATIMAGRGTDIRPAPDLPQRIARAAAHWMAEELESGGQAGFRLALSSREERDIVAGALEGQQLRWRPSRRQAGAWIMDVGTHPPATALPLTLGLRVIAFEHFGALRLDRQLRGRTGRQGAPGSSRFYVSLDEETVLLHGDRPRMAQLRRRAKKRLDPLSRSPRWVHRGLSQQTEQAWTNAEAMEERIRWRLTRFDGVDQEQRRHYEQERQSLLFATAAEAEALAQRALRRTATDFAREFAPPQGDVLQEPQLAALDDALHIWFERRLLTTLPRDPWPDVATVGAYLEQTLTAWYAVTRTVHGSVMGGVERTVLLDALTEAWRAMAPLRLQLRQQAGLFAYANRHPDEAYRTLIGQAYGQVLAVAARQAASTLVTFPLPREIKTPSTGQPVVDSQVLRLVGGAVT
jgi:preprotein translocase subunit SecA